MRTAATPAAPEPPAMPETPSARWQGCGAEALRGSHKQRTSSEEAAQRAHLCGAFLRVHGLVLLQLGHVARKERLSSSGLDRTEEALPRPRLLDGTPRNLGRCHALRQPPLQQHSAVSGVSSKGAAQQ
jgi:hypothetical protein